MKDCVAIIFGRVTDGLCLAVRCVYDSAVHRTHKDFSFAVTVPIESRDIGFHITCANHVWPDVYGP